MLNKKSVFRAILDIKTAEINLLKYARSGKEEALDNSYWFAKRNLSAVGLDLSSDAAKKMSILQNFSFLADVQSPLSFNFDLSLSQLNNFLTNKVAVSNFMGV
jgi:hypothetical protein